MSQALAETTRQGKSLHIDKDVVELQVDSNPPRLISVVYTPCGSKEAVIRYLSVSKRGKITLTA